MPQTRHIDIVINNLPADLGDPAGLDLKISYVLEQPEDFASTEGSQSIDITLPATKQNDKIFDTYWNPGVEDTAPPGSSPREWMPCTISANGVPVMKGYARLTEATATDKPEKYTFDTYGASAEWMIDLQNFTLWDCLSSTGIDSHAFTVENVMASWANFLTGEEQYDYVYAPVRYSQPFDGTTLGYGQDNCVNIYHLRPSLSVYWLLQRAFRQVGYTIKSQFFSTSYFRQLVLPWVWGDFYDINSQLVQGVCFKAAGQLPGPSEYPSPNGWDVNGFQPFWSGINSWETTFGSANGSSWWGNLADFADGYHPPAFNSHVGPAQFTSHNGTPVIQNGITQFGGTYIFDNNPVCTSGGHNWFHMDVVNPPDGFDNFSLTSFDRATGTLTYTFSPQPSIIATFSNVALTFVTNLYFAVELGSTGQMVIALECTQTTLSGDVNVNTQSIINGGGAYVGPGSGSSLFPQGTEDIRYPIVCSTANFTMPNVNPGDVLKFRFRICLDDTDAPGGILLVCSGGYLNNNPAQNFVPAYSYNPVTENYSNIVPNAIWTPVRSSIQMTGLLVQLGNTVNFQNYDGFRQHMFTDFLRGLVDTFNLEIQTDALQKTVTIEPMFGGTLPTGEIYDGYFSTQEVYDWTTKLDMGAGYKMQQFSDLERQVDLSFKNDGNDNAQNIWSQRYKGIYISNRTYTGGISQNNMNIDNGIVAGVPGSARYMLPNRFAKGNRQMSNNFFSAAMHCPFPQWANINGPSAPASPAPQLICMFPANATGEAAITQSYEPKLAWYAGQLPPAGVGGWTFIGDPARPTGGPGAYNLPYMFAVDYTGAAGGPVLSYSDENINGVQVPGLLTQFYLQRFAIIRNGQLMQGNFRLNLYDFCNWEHRESIMIGGQLYALIKIDGYNPVGDEATEVTLWKVVAATQTDKDNCYPSSTSILSSPLTLSQYDLRYAKLLLYSTDLPQENG